MTTQDSVLIIMLLIATPEEPSTTKLYDATSTDWKKLVINLQEPICHHMQCILDKKTAKATKTRQTRQNKRTEH